MVPKKFLLAVFLISCFYPVVPSTASEIEHSDNFGENGGVSCATCTVIVSFTEQLSVIHNETLIKSLERLCSNLPNSFREDCQIFAKFFGIILIESFTKEDSADTFCHKIGFCLTEPGKSECHLFPKKRIYKKHVHAHSQFFKKVLRYALKHVPHKFLKDPKICDLPGIRSICKWMEVIFDNHDPAVDLDNDKHSTYLTMRGSSWRGKDCDDNEMYIHPGRRPVISDRDKDTNCNGIMGVDPGSGQAYEDLYCKNSQTRGVVVLGDSMSAHFHLPREWFNTTEMSSAAFEPLGFILENEMDWPELSAITGYMNNTFTDVIHGPMDSIYNRLKQRNRCNHRDYQNLSVNGARSSSIVDSIQQSLYRNQTTDSPVILFYALEGNDVCNRYPDTISHMTTPEQMRNNSIKTLQYLEKTLPAGSYVFMVGLADGRVLYDSLKDRIHPIGSLRNDVTYSDFYDYLNCLQVSPCVGWLNTNATIRNMTKQRADQLSQVLKGVVQTEASKYHNFKLQYMVNPFNEVIIEWKSRGNPVWELLEPVDGFHINQLGQALAGQAIWKTLEAMHPDAIGPVNPFNSKIQAVFWDQGGY